MSRPLAASRLTPWAAFWLGMALVGLQTGSRGAATDEAYTLALLDDRSGASLVTFPIRVGERIDYRYVHSLERQEVVEQFRLGGDGVLYLIGSRSPQWGAGHLPRLGQFALSGEQPGWQEATGLKVALTPFVMFTSEASLAGIELVRRGAIIPLSKLFPNRHIRWEIHRSSLSLWERVG